MGTGFWGEMISDPVVTEGIGAGAGVFTTVRAPEMDFIDVENAYTDLSPAATTKEPSALIAICLI